MRHWILAGTAVAFTAVSAASFAAAPAKKDRAEARTEVPAHVAKMFARVDADRNGVITQAEIEAGAAARKDRMAAKADKKAERRDPAKMLARLDSNKDGRVTRAEADSAFSARAAAKGSDRGAKRADHLFTRVDANKDGVLTLAELNAAPKGGKSQARAGGKAGGHLARMAGLADSNRDGQITQAEMQAAAIARFDKADANRDGTVTPEERKALRGKMRAARTPS